MDFARLIIMACFFQLTACSQSSVIDNQESLKFSKYALAVCLGSAFECDSVKSDFNKSANDYMERGNMPLEALEEVRLAADKWLSKDYPSKHGGQVNSAKCFDFYSSNELVELFKKYDPCGSKDEWLSDDEFIDSCTTTEVEN